MIAQNRFVAIARFALSAIDFMSKSLAYTTEGGDLRSVLGFVRISNGSAERSAKQKFRRVRNLTQRKAERQRVARSQLQSTGSRTDVARLAMCSNSTRGHRGAIESNARDGRRRKVRSCVRRANNRSHRRAATWKLREHLNPGDPKSRQESIADYTDRIAVGYFMTRTRNASR